MTPAASESITSLTVSIQRLEDAIRGCDKLRAALRRNDASPTVAMIVGERLCEDAEMALTDGLINQIQRLTAMTLCSAKQIAWITEKLREEADAEKAGIST